MGSDERRSEGSTGH
jgi:hypothetical protein